MTSSSNSLCRRSWVSLDTKKRVSAYWTSQQPRNNMPYQVGALILSQAVRHRSYIPTRTYLIQWPVMTATPTTRAHSWVRWSKLTRKSRALLPAQRRRRASRREVDARCLRTIPTQSNSTTSIPTWEQFKTLWLRSLLTLWAILFLVRWASLSGTNLKSM